MRTEASSQALAGPPLGRSIARAGSRAENQEYAGAEPCQSGQDNESGAPPRI